MIYLYIVIIVVIFGGILYLLSRKRTAKPTGASEPTSEKPQESTETTETARATKVKKPPAATDSHSKKTPATAPPVQTKVQAMPPMVAELSSLPEEAKNALMNAIWYRCENPYCNYTQFLDVHHIVSEVEGGTNRLDNLIVLCPRCHLAADNHEIPMAELRYWVRERDKRFKSELDWPYK